MSNDRPTRESMSLEEATISNMWEIAALVEVLERKGYNPARQDNRESRKADQRTYLLDHWAGKKEPWPLIGSQLSASSKSSTNR